PQKARRVVDLVRGLGVDEAMTLLEFAPQGASNDIRKLIASAVANAESTEGLDGADLVVSSLRVDAGPTMKRWRPRAKGAANRILKRTSHISVVVQPREDYEAKRAARRGSRASRGADHTNQR